MALFIGAKFFYVYKNRYVNSSLLALNAGWTLIGFQLALAEVGCDGGSREANVP